MSFVRTSRVFSLLPLLLAAPTFAQFTESEPNDAKTTPNIFTASPGETITGITTGLAGTGDASIDFLRITTASAPLAIYRHRLQLTSPNSGLYNFSLRGSPQNNGVPAAGDALIQLASTATQPSNFIQWYGFGRSEFITTRVTGDALTAAPYTLTLQRETITPTIIAAPIAPGNITITTRNRTLADTEFWVYDENFFALTTFGNDDETTSGGGTNTTRQSIATRNLTEGVYYIAIADHNLANNLGSPTDDRFRIAAVLDSPASIAQSDVDAAPDLDFAIQSPAGTVEVLAGKPGPFGIAWFTFTVGPQDKPLALAAPTSVVEGQPFTLRATITPAASPTSTQISVTADASSLSAGTITLRDDGITPDTTANDNIFAATVLANTAAQANPLAIPLTITDAQSRTSLGTAQVTITPSATGACCTTSGCQQLRLFTCAQAAGTFQGPGSTCASTIATTNAAPFEPLPAATQLTLATITDGNLDDGRWTRPLPFPFTYNGDTFTQLNICTNGFIQFGPSTGYSTEYQNTPIPAAPAPNSLIAALWDDLEIPAQGRLETQTLGQPGHRRFIINWHNARQLAVPTDSFNFQIALFENTNRIELRYATMTPALTGTDFTIGLETADGTAGINIPPSQIAAGNTALAFAPAPAPCATTCDSIDFNNNQVFPEDQDVIDFFAVLAGSECASCNDIDFNNNQVFPEDADVITFFTVLAGGPCQ